MAKTKKDKVKKDKKEGVDIKPEYTLDDKPEAGKEKVAVDLPDGNDTEMMERKKELYSLGEKGFFLIAILSALLLLGWIFSLV